MFLVVVQEEFLKRNGRKQKIEETELKENYCSKYIHGNDKGDCVTKYEMPLDSFVCENGEMFEEYIEA